MKKLLSLFLLLFISLSIHAQFMNSSSNYGHKSKNSNGLYYSGNGPKYEGSLGFNLLYNAVAAGPCIDYEGGCRIRDFVFVGLGVGFHDLLNVGYDTYWLSVPIYANVKGFLPLREDIMPFINFSIGGHLSWDLNDYDIYDGYIYYGLYTTVGLGIEWDMHQFSLGYELDGYHCGFFKYAVRF